MRLVPIERSGITAVPTQGNAEVLGQVVEATVSLYVRRGYQPPWTGYFALEGEEVLGTCGFVGPPNAGEVEIAYFTFPGNEGRGIATAMARELLRLSKPAAVQGGIRYIAHTLPQNGPSTTILRKLGFTLESELLHPEDGLVWKWSQRAASEA